MRVLLVSLLTLGLTFAGCSSDEDKSSTTNRTPSDSAATGGDTDVTPGDSDTTVPPNWACSETYYDDGQDCDCGCGAIDPDCETGCAEPGCESNDCKYCYDAEGLYAGCPAPEGWTCSVGEWNDFICDCGCGVADKACETGCVEADCSVEGCEWCHNAAHAGSSCAHPGWVCPDSFYGDDGCDCGCGIADVDCTSGGCTTPGCTDAGCAYCWDAEGENICPEE